MHHSRRNCLAKMTHVPLSVNLFMVFLFLLDLSLSQGSDFSVLAAYLVFLHKFIFCV